MTEICHVCGKEKEPYTILMNSNIISFTKYEMAREDGPICERCNKYFAMTGEFHEPTEKEFENAKKASWFANMMLLWWKKKKPLEYISLGTTEPDNTRDWEGTYELARWCREQLNKE